MNRARTVDGSAATKGSLSMYFVEKCNTLLANRMMGSGVANSTKTKISNIRCRVLKDQSMARWQRLLDGGNQLSPSIVSGTHHRLVSQTIPDLIRCIGVGRRFYCW